MEDHNSVWPPPPKNQIIPVQVVSKPYYTIRFFSLDIVLGIALGAFNTTRADHLADWFAFSTAAILGYIHPRTGWISVLTLAVCLYVAHIIAITHGIGWPYVEDNVYQAEGNLGEFMPYAVWATGGALIKSVVNRIQQNRTKRQQM